MTNPARAQEVLYDSETVLRLVDHELNELRDPESSGENMEPPSGVAQADEAQHDLSGFLAMLHQANDEISKVLGTLRNGRQALQGATIDRLHDSNAKIREVSNATEVAATDIMDGLDRAQALIDKLDAIGESSADGPEIRAELRNELFAMMQPLQFQDITTQQLAHVGSMLTDVEARLRTVAAMLGGAKLGGKMVNGDDVFAESASILHVTERQAAADALFAPRSTQAHP